MESLLAVSTSSNSGKGLGSRNSRIPVKIRKTLPEDKHEDKHEPPVVTSSKCTVAITTAVNSMQPKENFEIVAVPKDSSNDSPNSTSNTSLCSVLAVPLPEAGIEPFTLPRTRVKSSSSSSSPNESHTNLQMKKMRGETEKSLPVQELPKESSSHDKMTSINEWVESGSNVPSLNLQTNEIRQSLKSPTIQIPEELPELIIPQEDSMSIIHKTDDDYRSAKASENAMVMDIDTMPTLVEEPVEQPATSSQTLVSVPVNFSSTHIPPTEISPANMDTSISEHPERPVEGEHPITESEIESSTHSIILSGSGYGSCSGTSVQSRAVSERAPTFLMNHCQANGSTSSRQATAPGASYCGSLISSVTTARTKTFSKTRNTPTYEDLFYKKKAFITHGPSAIRSNHQETVPFSHKFAKNQADFISQQHAAVTRVITETVTEYEVQEGKSKDRKRRKHRDGQSNTKKPHGGIKKGKLSTKRTPSRIPRLAIADELASSAATGNGLKAILPSQSTAENLRYLGAESRSPKIVTIVEQPAILETIDEEPLEVGTESTERCSSTTVQDKVKNKNSRARSRSSKKVSISQPRELVVGDSGETESSHGGLSENSPSLLPPMQTTVAVTDSNVPTVILAGHGNLHLEVPTPESLSRESSTAEQNKDINYAYRKCASYKRLLKDSETTIRYLHQLLAIKEEKLEKAKIVNESVSAGDDISNNGTFVKVESGVSENANRAPQMNRLVLKQLSLGESSSAIPKFDMDEFIRKWYRIVLSQDSGCTNCGNNGNTPFQRSQLFRLSIAARTAICEDLRHQLKNGNDILRHKYDKLQTKIASNDPDSNAARIRLVDAYRRFVSYVYHYFNESLKSVEKFDEKYMAQQKNNDKEKRKILYFHETKIAVDGVQYYGLFLPIAVEAQ
ncbi:hypothetical protein Ocin01_08740 [Orchesella cincta]|uniref:Uncharacterized protein n=1 Tax=Orchesella cincta TaxID=48709 RepID=A0A1D2MY58_ORCCI|nr:hypothetical protein Ocin01_08740 [Orchesella cincta]